MNARDFRRSIRSAKDLWPLRAPMDADWNIRLASLLIFSRRKGLTEGEFVEFDKLVQNHIGELLDVGERWLVSIADTYVSESASGGSAAAAMVAISAIRMMEKFHSAAYHLKNGRPTDPVGGDVHINFGKRLSKIWAKDPHLWAIFTKFAEILASDETSVVGKFEAMATKEIYQDIKSCDND